MHVRLESEHPDNAGDLQSAASAEAAKHKQAKSLVNSLEVLVTPDCHRDQSPF